jgi:phosphatidylserine decarboxylase
MDNHLQLSMHILSRMIGKVANSRIGWLKNFLIKLAIKYYKIDLSLAAEPNPKNYDCFNAFFTRALRSGARTIVTASGAIACPVDGKISQIGNINGQEIIQAKGFNFNIDALFGNVLTEYSAKFMHGHFTTIYLSPRDYHRIHMPFAGRLLAMAHIPGKLFSVQPKIVSKTPNLYARNERVVIVFVTAIGLMTIVLVGAVLVASISTVWAGEVTPPTSKQIRTWNYNEDISFKCGEEIGRFQFGSTVILMFEPNAMQWDSNIKPEAIVKMGQQVGMTL